MTPHSTNDVRADWRWFYEVIVWPSAPKTFQTFWEKVESSGLLTCFVKPRNMRKNGKIPYLPFRRDVDGWPGPTAGE